MAKNEKACSEKNSKDVTEQPFDKDISMGMHQFNQSPQQKPATEMGLYQQKYCQLGLKEKRENETK